MKSFFVKRGWIALVAVCSLAALQATATAQTPVYWGGGSGTWASSGGSAWFSSATIPSWSGAGTVEGWNAANGGTAMIGYINNNGSGGYYGTTAITQYGAPTVITLDSSNAITANQVNFGYVGASSASATASAYELTGGTLNTGNIVLDLSYSSGHNPGGMRATINSNINATGNGGTLNFTTLQTSATGTAGGVLDLGGANTFSTLNIGGIQATSAISSAYWSGVVITNTAAFSNNANVILGNNAELASLCANGQNINVGSVTLLGNSGTYAHASTYGAYSTSGIGRLGVGAYTDPAHSSPYMTINGPITGPSDLVFGSGAGNDGRGVTILNAQSTYTGDTFMQQSSNRWAGDPEGMAVVQLGINNALPVTTNLIFGRNASTGNSGALDLHGYSQTVRSIGSMLSGVGTTTNDFCGGITNFNSTPGSAGMGTLNVLNDMGQASSYYGNPNFIEAQFHGIIGATILDASGRPTQSSNSNNNIQFNLLAGTSNGGSNPGFNGLSLTLGLAGSNEAPPAYPVNQSNTYGGGTNISGGALFAANGRVFSTVAGQQNSATGTGYVQVNSGGTLGGSVAGGAIGMPSTGPVTINNGGYLLPGGGWFVSSQGLGAGGYGSGGTVPTFHPVANLPLNVLGDLNLNSGANVNFNVSSSQADLLEIGGALNLPSSGTVNVLVNTTNGTSYLASGTPIFEFNGSLTGNTATLVSAAGSSVAGITFQEVGNEIDMIVPGAKQLSRWSGNGTTSAAWNTSTSNFTYLGNAATFSNGNTVLFDDTASSGGTVNISGTSVSPARVQFANAAKAYTVTGGAIADNGGTPASVLVSGGGIVTFANTNTYTGGTTVNNSSTLVVNSPQALPNTGTVSQDSVTIQDASTLQLNYTNNGNGTYSGTINTQAGGLGTGATPSISVPTGQTAVFNGILGMDWTNGIGLNKTGSGTLILAGTANQNDQTGGSSYGAVNVNAGLLRVEQVGTLISGSGTAEEQTLVSQLGRGPLTIGRSGNGGALWLDNVTIGANANYTPSLGFVDVYTGGTLGGTGKAAYAQENISLVMNTINSARSPGSFTLATGTSKTDSLALQSSFESYDNNSGQNNYEDFQLTGATNNAGLCTSIAGSYTPAMTVHVAGSGTVKLQAGEAQTKYAFGGPWSVDSGILQVGPFVADTNYLASGGTGTQWSGANGEALNALGFATPIGQNIRGQTAVQGNPDLPNPVTVNNGGILAIAVDQINANPSNTETGTSGAVNTTQPYIRSAVTLNNGAAVAATGAEVTFYQSGGTAQAISTQANSAVTARFGGNFAVSSGGTASVLTYDPNGLATDYLGNTIAADGIARTVELVGGSYTLTNSCAGLAAGTVVSNSTNWAGTLVVASSNGVGGTFNIKRSGGVVSVASGASMVVQSGATVNISDDNSSMLVSSTASGTYGQMVAPSSGPTSLPTLNNVLSAGGNSVAINNGGTFNVNNGYQTVGAITGGGAFNVTGTATASAPSISQGSASVASGATLNINGAGIAAPSMTISNAGTVNVTGGTGQTVASVQGTGSLSIGAGAKITLAGASSLPVPQSSAGGLSINPTGDLDVGRSGIVVSNVTDGGVGIESLIKQGYAAGGSSGITSSYATANHGVVGVGMVYTGSASKATIASVLVGDLNLDGEVDATDLNKLVANLGGSVTAGQNWQSGDINYDGEIDATDLNALVANLGNNLPAAGGVQMAQVSGIAAMPSAVAAPAASVAAVPEPGTLALLAAGLAAAGIAAFRRRANKAAC